MVRGTSRRSEAAEAIETTGAEFALADPDRIAAVLDHVADVAVIVWLLASAEGDADAVAALHGPRLERLLEELVDTPVRGFAYEATGTVSRAAMEKGSGLVAAASERWRVPTQLIDASTDGHEQWLTAALNAVEALVAPS
jgi:hypothetical protein